MFLNLETIPSFQNNIGWSQYVNIISTFKPLCRSYLFLQRVSSVLNAVCWQDNDKDENHLWNGFCNNRAGGLAVAKHGRHMVRGFKRRDRKDWRGRHLSYLLYRYPDVKHYIKKNFHKKCPYLSGNYMQSTPLFIVYAGKVATSFQFIICKFLVGKKCCLTYQFALSAVTQWDTLPMAHSAWHLTPQSTTRRAGGKMSSASLKVTSWCQSLTVMAHLRIAEGKLRTWAQI